MTIYTEQSIIDLFNKKKASAEARYIAWEFTLDEFKTLLHIKDIIGRCAYTNKKFGTGDNLATLERVDHTKSYNKNNVLWVTSKANKLKSLYVEQEKSMKGIPSHDISTVHRISKILNAPNGIESIMKPYKEHYDALQARLNKNAKASKLAENISSAEEERIKREKETQKKKFYLDQKELAEYYVSMYTAITTIGGDMQLSLKELRDKLRINRCSISKQPFETLKDKHYFIKDKSIPVTKDNILIVTKEVQESLDYLAKGNNEILKISATNLLKHIK